MAGVAMVSLLLHVVVAVTASIAMRAMYPHRIFNVRAWSNEGTERYHLVGSFLSETASDESRPVIAFAGSSVSYGYPWDERFIFSRLFAERRPASKVINASIVATDISGVNDWIVCAARRNRIRIDALVIEIPVVNTTSHLVQSLRGPHKSASLEACAVGPPDPGYFTLAATRPRGIGWFPFLWDNEARETIESTVHIIPVPKDYFASAAGFDEILADYAGRITTTLTNAQQVAGVVYAFPSPIYVGGLEEIGEDAPAIRHQLQSTVDACRAVPGARCVDTAAMWMNRSYYYNLTHLNQAGHRAMADLFAAAIDVPQRHAAP
jgi:hypothetical protein